MQRSELAALYFFALKCVKTDYNAIYYRKPIIRMLSLQKFYLRITGEDVKAYEKL